MACGCGDADEAGERHTTPSLPPSSAFTGRMMLRRIHRVLSGAVALGKLARTYSRVDTMELDRVSWATGFCRDCWWIGLTVIFLIPTIVGSGQRGVSRIGRTSSDWAVFSC